MHQINEQDVLNEIHMLQNKLWGEKEDINTPKTEVWYEMFNKWNELWDLLSELQSASQRCVKQAQGSLQGLCA